MVILSVLPFWLLSPLASQRKKQSPGLGLRGVDANQGTLAELLRTMMPSSLMLQESFQ